MRLRMCNRIFRRDDALNGSELKLSLVCLWNRLGCEI
jgi:hypothetical protein